MGETRRYFLFALLLSILATGLFLPGLGGGFIFDDKPNIVENASVYVSHLTFEQLAAAAYSFEPGSGSRPLAMLSFGLDYWRAGMNPVSFKCTNLLIHAITVFALIAFFGRLFLIAGWEPRRAAVVALVLGLVWGGHPLQVSTVLYVVQRMQTLGTLFLILALWAYLGMREVQIKGGAGRQYAVLVVLFWLLAIASKEDSALLPAYTLLLELTVLGFRAKSDSAGRRLQATYLLLVTAGLVAFLFWVVPHFWHWDAYPGRDFSSYERLLTQLRVLVMYLGQVIVPLPAGMPFYYDDLEVSRGLFAPVTTFLALLLVGFLLVSAWCFRKQQPLICFGVLLFFAGHFVSSNVLNLELAFEHRNHFPLIGVVLAGGLSIVMLVDRYVEARERRLAWLFAGASLALLSLGGATLLRAHWWGEPQRFAEKSVAIAPRSERAWLLLSGVFAGRSGLDPGSPDFDRAIVISVRGAALTGSPPLLSNIVVFKTMRGDVAKSDWSDLLDRLRQTPMSVQNRNILWVMLGNVDKGVKLDPSGVLSLIDIVAARSRLNSEQNLRLGAYIHNKTQQPERALPYLRRAVELAGPGDPAVERLLRQLRDAGRAGWAGELAELQRLNVHETNAPVTK